MGGQTMYLHVWPGFEDTDVPWQVIDAMVNGVYADTFSMARLYGYHSRPNPLVIPHSGSFIKTAKLYPSDTSVSRSRWFVWKQIDWLEEIEEANVVVASG